MGRQQRSNNNSGRGRQSRGNGGGGKAKKDTATAGTTTLPAMKGHVFPYNVRGALDQFRETLKRLVTVVGSSMGPEIAQELSERTRFVIEEPQIPQAALDEHAAKLARQRIQHERLKEARQHKLDYLRVRAATPGPPGTPNTPQSGAPATVPPPPPHPDLLIEIAELENLMDEADALLDATQSVKLEGEALSRHSSEWQTYQSRQ